VKIGAFAKKYMVSIDTIRHYMDLGLLFPGKKNGQYVFGDDMCSQMDEIIKMKACGLTLNEIGHYLYYRRFNDIEINGYDIDIQFFESKRKKIIDHIQELEQFKKKY